MQTVNFHSSKVQKCDKPLHKNPYIYYDAVVVGQGDKFEIWDQARFKALLSQDFDDVADELAESGIDFSF